MNVHTKEKSMMLTAGLILLFLASCNNPTGARISDYSEPSTGIDSDPSIGLVASLPLEGDAIINHPDVTMSDSVTWEEGLSGNAMRGDEDGDFFRIADGSLPELTTAGTIEVWIYPEHTDTDDNYSAGILHKGDELDFSDEAWSLQNWNSEEIAFNYQYGSGGATYKQVKSTYKISVETWHHIAVTWNYDDVSGDTVLSLYIDGILDVNATYNGIGPMIDSDGDIIVGSQLPGPYNASFGHMTFMGLIDEVSLYDHPRSAEDILADYQVYFPAP